MSVVFIFIDGVGIGSENSYNPVMSPEWGAFDWLTDGQGLDDKARTIQKKNLHFSPVDANLGVDGLPQSGTGQTALFTGENAARIAGRHYGPFPHSATKILLQERSLFHKIQKSGFKPAFINAYPERYIEKLKRTGRWNCSALMAVSSGLNLNSEEEVKKGNALTAEITQRIWREKLGVSVPDLLPEEAADRLLSSAENSDLVLFEYYLTDKAGHLKSKEMSFRVLSVLNRFLLHLLKSKGEEVTIVVSSDHGNMEDLSVKTHTRNPVPLMVCGRGSDSISDSTSIMDVPGIIRTLLVRSRERE